MKQVGFEVHYIQPLWGHQVIKGIKGGAKSTLFPTGKLPTWINSSILNLSVEYSRAEHIEQHMKLLKLENFWSMYHSPFYTAGKMENDILYNGK